MIHVCMSSFFDDRNARRTGLSRFELGIAAEFVKTGASLVAYSPFRRGMVALQFQRNVTPIAHHQDAPLIREAGAGAQQRGERTRAPSRAIARMAASFAGSAVPHLRAMLFSPSAAFAPGDTLLVPGIVWSAAALGELRRLNSEHRVRIVPYIHDLIPIRRPEFFTDAIGVSRFRRYADFMAEIADRICVNSAFVAADVRAFLAETGRANTPVFGVPLCPDINRLTSRCSTPRLEAMNLEPGGFALYVSTVNARKNHEWLFEIWRTLATGIPDSLLPLVIAGQRGWGVGDLVDRMSADAAVWGRAIYFVEAPTDAEVAHLYETCAFTVFPSRYEGWGMGVTESLEFGKPCIAADNTALKEAGLGLAIHIDLADTRAWTDAIHRMSKDHAYRQQLSETIRDIYRPRSWADVARDLMQVLVQPREELTRSTSALHDAAPDRPR